MKEAASTNSEVVSRAAAVATAPPVRRARQQIQISLTVGCLALGVLLALQVNTQRAMRDGNLPMRKPDRWYQEELRERDKKLRSFEQQNADLGKRVRQFEATSGASSKQSRLLQKELESARMLAGLLPVSGPGLVVIVADNPKATKLPGDTTSGIIHDDDLLKVTNDLWNAGAEAIAINGIRLGAGWNIRCAGSTILVCGQRVTSPCRIEAVGNPELMQSAVNMPDGVGDYLRNLFQLKVTVRTSKGLRLPGASPAPLKSARPAPEPNGGGS